MIEAKIGEIWDWMGRGENIKGVTNKQVKGEFGENYFDAWRRLKTRKRYVFYEDKKWHRWFGV